MSTFVPVPSGRLDCGATIFLKDRTLATLAASDPAPPVERQNFGTTWGNEGLAIARNRGLAIFAHQNRIFSISPDGEKSLILDASSLTGDDWGINWELACDDELETLMFSALRIQASSRGEGLRVYSQNLARGTVTSWDLERPDNGSYSLGPQTACVVSLVTVHGAQCVRVTRETGVQDIPLTQRYDCLRLSPDERSVVLSNLLGPGRIGVLELDRGGTDEPLAIVGRAASFAGPSRLVFYSREMRLQMSELDGRGITQLVRFPSPPRGLIEPAASSLDGEVVVALWHGADELGGPSSSVVIVAPGTGALRVVEGQWLRVAVLNSAGT